MHFKERECILRMKMYKEMRTYFGNENVYETDFSC